MGDMSVDHQEQPPADPRIVVGVDGSESSLQALERAARYAELTGAALEVITTWAWPATYGWPPQIPADWDPLADVTKELDKIVDQLRQARPDVTVHPRVLEGHAAPVLIEASRGAELLVVGSRGHGEFTGMLLGSVGEHCVSHAHCPVLVERGDG
jgi:nucleotide-binding universal stress UspA family protein